MKSKLHFFCMLSLVFALLPATAKPVTTKTIPILVIEGGGARGIIPAILLSHITSYLHHKHLADHFEIISGVSTGAIIAAMLAFTEEGEGEYKYTADEIVKFYEQKASQIFTSSFLSRSLPYRLFAPVYSNDNLQKILEEELSDFQISDFRKNVIISSYDINNETVLIFNSRKAQLDTKDDYYLRDALLASTAAPTYFPAAKIHPINKPNLVKVAIDGSISGNNTAIFAIAEAINIYGRDDNVEFLIIHFGTGKKAKEKVFTHTDIKKTGLMFWSQHIVETLMVSNSDAIAAEVKYLFDVGLIKGRYISFDPPLIENYLSVIDDANDETIEKYKLLTTAYIAKNHERLKQVAEMLNMAYQQTEN